MSDTQMVELPVDVIHKNRNDRTEEGAGFGDSAMTELKKSIESVGLLEPILVRPMGDGTYELVCGERRWRAHKDLGKDSIRALVMRLDDSTASKAMLIENLARVDLDPIDEGHAYRHQVDEFGHSIESVAEMTGKSTSHVRGRIALTHLVDEAQYLIRSGQMFVSNARDLVGLDPDRQRVCCRVWANTPNLTIEGWNAMISDLRSAANQDAQGSFEMVVEDMTAKAVERSVRRPPVSKLLALLEQAAPLVEGELADDINEALTAWDAFYCRRKKRSTQ